MARPTKEQQAARLAGEVQGAEGVVGNTNTPPTNTHEGILEKQAAAEQQAGLIPANNQDPIDPLSLNNANPYTPGETINTGTIDYDSREFETQSFAKGIEDKGIGELQGAEGENGFIPGGVGRLENIDTSEMKIQEQIPALQYENDKIIIFGYEFPESMREQLFKDGVLGGSDQGDHVIFNELEVEDYVAKMPKEKQDNALTQEQINEVPYAEQAGIVIGDNYNDAMAKYDGYLQANPHLYNPEHPNYKPIQDLVTTEDMISFPFLSKVGVTVGEVKTDELQKKVQDFLEANPWEYPTDSPYYKPKPEDNTEYVYHGDFLTVDQLGNKVTYDWDEVTAPEHLLLKP
uniref:Uncharacterized protein n=1 Tax=Tanacetum cinerariifolium TaxID=118510 RepID=A0A699IIM3_TANCI|nr:hypothetical protein [Tanacetum cinerariifolium]